jgi:hypothetical protein
LKKIPHGHPPEEKNRMVIYPHVVTVDGSVSTEEAGVQVGLSQQKQLVRDLLRVKIILEIEELTQK